jgi:adenylate cyclase class IV
MLSILNKRLSVDARNTVGRYVAIEEPDSDTDSIDEMNAEYSQILSELVLPGASLSDDPKRWRLKNLMDEPKRGSG